MTRQRSSRAATEATLEFGRFRVLLRQRQLVSGGAPIKLGTRAFDFLLVLLEADGSLVTKDERMSRVWPDIAVAEENLKVRFSLCARPSAKTARLSEPGSDAAIGFPPQFTRPPPGVLISARRCGAACQAESYLPNGFLADRCTVGGSRDHSGSRLDPAHKCPSSMHRQRELSALGSPSRRWVGLGK